MASTRHLPPGHCKSADELRRHIAELALPIRLHDAPGGPASPLAQPITVHGRRLGNRFATHPMEGWDGTADGAPTALTLRRWRHFGRSGAALIWGGEAFAVQPDGRANPNQLCLGEHSEAHLRALLAELREGRREVGGDPAAMFVGLQLTHSGRFARPHGPLAPRISQRHPVLAAKYGLDAATPLLSDLELEGIGERMVAAAQVAQRAGFDFVDVKCCHGYLLHEVLAGHTREGSYGGPFQNRVRLFVRIVEAIRAACPGLHVGVRLSAGDIAPFQAAPGTRIGEPMTRDAALLARHHFGIADDDVLAMDLRPARQFVALCRDLGIELVNVTLGSPYWNPHLQRPATYPPSDGYLPPVDPLRMVAQHLCAVRALATPGVHLVGTGYTYLQEWLPHVAAQEVHDGHAAFVGLGRLLLSYPELPVDLLAGRPLQIKRICRTFSDCTTGPRNGMVSGCYPLDPHYKAMPEAARVRAIKKDLAT